MSFFENYKRPIYIVVAILALIVFSITGVVLTFFSELFRPQASAESIELPSGERSTLTEEDLQVGLALGRMQRNLVRGGVDMPAFVFSSVGVDNPRETFGILRRAAIDRGIDVADEDVQAALDFACRQKEAPQPGQPAPPRWTPVRLARVLGATSIVELEELVREALRVSVLVRSEMQAVDLSEAALADFVKKQRKQRSLSYVSFEGKKFREEIERLKPTDEDLKSWIAGLDEGARLPYFNAEIVSFATAGLIYDQVDPSEWTELLDGVEIQDSEIEARYNADKEALYKLETPGDGEKDKQGKKDDKKPAPGDGERDQRDGGLLGQDPKPEAEKGGDKQGPAGPAPAPAQDTDDGRVDDGKDGAQGPIGPVPADQVGYRRIDEVKEEIKAKLRVEAIIKRLAEKAEEARNAVVQKARKEAEEAAKKDAPKDDAKKDDAKKADDTKEGAGEGAKSGDGDKKDGDSKDGGLLSQSPLQGIPGEVPEMSPEEAAKAAKAAQERIQKQRQEAALFDFKAWYEDNMAGKKGVIWIAPKKELLPPDKFQDFPPFGKWGSYWSLGQLQDIGAISNLQSAEKGAFFFRVVDRLSNQMKAMDEIREDATENYFATESSKKAKKAGEDFRKLVRTKAEGLLAEEVAKLRDAVPGKVAEQMKEWRSKLDARVAEVKAKLEQKALPQAAIPILQKQLEEAQGQLALEDKEKERVQKVEDDALEEKLVELVAPKLSEAFDLAAKESKLEVQKLGPFFEDESFSPRFSLREAGPDKFLRSNGAVKSGEEGDVLEPVEDAETQSWYIVRVDAVQEGGEDALTRKAIEASRKNFLSDRMGNVLAHSFDLRAIKKRYAWKTTRKADEYDDEANSNSKPDDKKGGQKGD